MTATKTQKDNIAALEKARERVRAGGGSERTAKQHNDG